jgi:hypothetical protein
MNPGQQAAMAAQQAAQAAQQASMRAAQQATQQAQFNAQQGMAHARQAHLRSGHPRYVAPRRGFLRALANLVATLIVLAVVLVGAFIAYQVVLSR